MVVRAVVAPCKVAGRDCGIAEQCSFHMARPAQWLARHGSALPAAGSKSMCMVLLPCLNCMHAGLLCCWLLVPSVCMVYGTCCDRV